MSVELHSSTVMGLTLSSVTHPQVPAIRRLLDEYGYDTMLEVVTRVVIMADVALGGDGDSSRCQMAAASAMISNSHRSLSFLLLAIREGMAGGSKAYGKINTQVLNEWVSDLTAKLLGMAEADHSRVVIKNDNLGSDWMNRLEHDSTKDKARIAHLSRQVGELKNKLSEKP